MMLPMRLLITLYFSNTLCNLTDFLLDFACEFFILAFGRQIGVVGDLDHLLFDRALNSCRFPLI